MRNIGAQSLAILSNPNGIEPLILIAIDWSGEGLFKYYSDKENVLLGVKGSIISVNNLENIVNISGSSSSSSLSITLDDTDLEINEIINTVDVHKKPIRVYQWFEGLNLNERFLLFEGEISSPMVWSEADLTFSFDAVSKIEDVEVGFSADEGQFDYVPPNILNRAWPLIFGTVVKVPAIRINDVPAGLSTSSVYVPDTESNGATNNLPTIVDNNRLSFAQLNDLFRLALNTAFAYYAAADSFRNDAFLVSAGFISGIGLPDSATSLSLADRMEQEGDKYSELAGKYLQEAYVVNAAIGSNAANEFNKESLESNQLQVVNSDQFPQGDTLVLNIGGANHEGYFSGKVFNITSRTTPLQDIGIITGGPPVVYDGDVTVRYESNLSYQNVFFAPGGSLIKISALTVYPIKYIVSINHNSVLQVWAEKNGIAAVVPTNYYSVETVNFNDLPATLITFPKALSTIDSTWSDDIYCDLSSGLSNNVADILIYLINTYTDKAYDTASFNQVRTLSTNYPCNFALLDRKNIVTVLEEIAFQARCAIYYKEGTFYIKYLPKKMTPVTTITDDDIEFRTLSISSSSTEDLVTKLVATYRTNYFDDDKTATYKHNVAKYGTQEQTFDFYIYNSLPLVEKSAVFWLIRKANTWKKVSFNTFLTKLQLETWDTVTLDLSDSLFSNGPIDAIVESCAYDSDSKTVILTCWVPIKWGSRDEYVFALPAQIDQQYQFPLIDGTRNALSSAITGNPYSQASGELVNQTQVRGGGYTGDFANTRRNPTTGFLQSDLLDSLPNNVYVHEPQVINEDKDISALNFNLKQFQVKPLDSKGLAIESGKQFPGKVQQLIEGSDYFVDTYFAGKDEEPTPVRVTQLFIKEGYEIPQGTWVMVTYNLVPLVIQNINVGRPEYTMQVPVWAGDIEEDEEP